MGGRDDEGPRPAPRAATRGSELRSRAEEAIRGRGPRSFSRLSIEETARLIFELEVHQEELRLQNEELARFRLEAEERSARYAELYELAPVAYLTLDRDGTIRRANRAAESLLATARARLVESRLGVFIQSGHIPVLNDFLARIFGGGSIPPCEVALRREDGAPVWALMDAALSAGGEECRAGLIDLTEHVRAEATIRHLNESLERRVAERTAALSASEETYRRLFEQAADGIFLTDMRGNFVSVNAAGAAMLGRTREEILRTSLPATIEAEGLFRFQEDVAGPATDGVIRSRWRFHRGDGTLFPGEMTGRRIPGDRVQICLRDVAERERLEARLRQQERMESIGRLAGGIAHDFNNLLTVINGAAEVAASSARDDDPLLPDLHLIRDAGIRAAALTRQLLAFSRQQVLRPSLVNLNAIVSGLEPMLRRLIGEDITLTSELAADLASVRVDPGQIEQVIINLVANARDAMPGGGKLTIVTANVEVAEAAEGGRQARKGRPGVILHVRDSGTGMDETTREHLFDPFFTTKRVGRGTGLGLSTVHGIVQQSGGEIEVESEPGRGTSVRIRLPATAETPIEDRPAAAAVEPRGTETILIVEDDDSVRHLSERVLRSAGYTVLVSSSAEDALRLLGTRRQEVHLVLSDVVMPGMGGEELAERVRREHPSMRILLTSGYWNEAKVRSGLLQKGLHFIGKPYSVADLKRRVREVLDAET